MTSILERALELASSGRFTKIEYIERTLTREGYTRVYEHLSGATIRRALRERMRHTAPARAKAPPLDASLGAAE